jgi:hypothetical protein
MVAIGVAWPASAPAQPVTCGQVITSTTRLTADLRCPRDGLVIGRDGITLDLGGHVISAPRSGTGVDLAGHSRITVRNGKLEGFVTHVQLGRTPGVVRDVRIVGLEFSDGEFATDGYADSSLVAFNASADTRTELGLFGGDFQIAGDHNLVVGNSARTNALAVGGSQNHVVLNRVGNLNAAPGLKGGNVIAANVAQTFLVYGGAPEADAPTITLTHNRSVPRKGDEPFGQGGIYLLGVSHAIVKDNTVTTGEDPNDRPTTGISVFALEEQPAIGTRLVGNFVQGALINGIFVESDAVSTLLLRNVTVGNGTHPAGIGQDGIQNNSPSSTLTENVANDNRVYGIESVPGAIDGGGNRASGNGNPLQCLNVVCR